MIRTNSTLNEMISNLDAFPPTVPDNGKRRRPGSPAF
jgi:hypothetical protein